MRRRTLIESAQTKSGESSRRDSRLFAIALVLLCAAAALAVFAGTGYAEESGQYGDCGFLFCEPEDWLSWQNAIHFTTTYSLHVTATAMNDRPWFNFLWISALGTGVEVFQGAFLDHPLRGGFSYKNVVFNQLGLLAGLAVNRFLVNRGSSETQEKYDDVMSQPPQPAGISALPLARYLQSCDCNTKHPFEKNMPAFHSLRPAMAGLLKPDMQSKYRSDSRRILLTPQKLRIQI